MGEIMSVSVRNFINQPSNQADAEWNKKPVVAESKPAPTAESRSFLSKLLFTPAPSPIGCMNDEPKKPTTTETLKQDGGELPMSQPKTDGGLPDGISVLWRSETNGATITGPTPQGDAGGEANPINPTDPNVNVNLPHTDAGVPVLPDDVFFQINGTGLHFQQTPRINETLPFTPGTQLQTLNLSVKLGLDSTAIQMPNTTPAKFLGCFDGLVRMNQLTSADIENQVPGCSLPGYESFALCPGTNIDLKVYLAGYTLEGFRYQNGQPISVGKKAETLSDPSSLNVNDSNGKLLGNSCGATPNPYLIGIPKEYYSDGTLTLALSFNLIVKGMDKDPNGTFYSALRASVVIDNNNQGIDGGTK